MLKKIFSKYTIIFISLFFCQRLYAQNASNLSLDQYLNQVRDKNLNIEQANQSDQSFELLKKKAKLVSAIKLYGFSEAGFAEQNRGLQFLRYKSVQTQNNRIGFSQESEFGINSNIYYSLNNTRYIGLAPGFTTNPLATKNTQAIPVLELSIPLWQNFLGKTTTAKKDASFYENESKQLSAKALSQEEMVNAEKRFWHLVFAQKNLEIQNRALNSANKILDYLNKKEKMNLAEKSDVLQAKAIVESKKLAVKQAENFLKISARNFNQSRNINSDEVKEKLTNFDLTKLQNIALNPIRNSDRLDIKSRQAQLQASLALARIEEENNKPSLNLYTSYAVNQVEPNRMDAISATFDRSAPNGKIGLEFSMPLNVGVSADIRHGARLQASSHKTSYQEKLLQQEIDWKNLIQNFKDWQENLRLSMQIEATQKAKLENERNLLSKGRTSTYQILVFEQEFSSAELNTQQIAQKLYELIADQKLYQPQ